MKKLGKTLSFYLLLCMMVFATGCGNTQNGNSQNDMAGNTATQDQADTGNQSGNPNGNTVGNTNGNTVGNTGNNNGDNMTGAPEAEDGVNNSIIGDEGNSNNPLNNSVTDPAGDASDGNRTNSDLTDGIRNAAQDVGDAVGNAIDDAGSAADHIADEVGNGVKDMGK